MQEVILLQSSSIGILVNIEKSIAWYKVVISAKDLDITDCCEDISSHVQSLFPLIRKLSICKKRVLKNPVFSQDPQRSLLFLALNLIQVCIVHLNQLLPVCFSHLTNPHLSET